MKELDFIIVAIVIDKEGNVTSHTEKITSTFKVANTLMKAIGKNSTSAFLMYDGELICKVGA